MANLNDLDDVTISNPKVGEVVKYTATGWQNAADATGSPVGGNPCGDMDGYTRCLLYTSPSPRDQRGSRMPSSA